MTDVLKYERLSAAGLLAIFAKGRSFFGRNGPVRSSFHLISHYKGKFSLPITNPKLKFIKELFWLYLRTEKSRCSFI